MPYLRKWIPAVAALAHVMRADDCARFDAIQQIETAVRERELRWTGGNRWNWDHGEVFRTDLEKLWPLPLKSALRENLEAAFDKSEEQLPDKRELRNLADVLAAQKNAIRREILIDDAETVSPTQIESKIHTEEKKIEADLLAQLERGEVIAFVERPEGLVRLPSQTFWIDPEDKEPTGAARLALAHGTVEFLGTVSAVMVRAGDDPRPRKPAETDQPAIDLKIAVTEALKSGSTPGKGGMPWALFNRQIWARCGKVNADWGFGTKSIERMVTKVKSDKSDNRIV